MNTAAWFESHWLIVVHALAAMAAAALGAILAIRAGDIQKHKKDMASLYILALLQTGAFTLYPGRIMRRVIFC